MADLKPIGSEKLTGDDKLKRILELTYYKNNNKPTNKTAELVSESKHGSVYGIVKEKDGYYVKKGLNESSLDYIGGLFMKNKNKFSSYNEAYKRLEFLKGQEELNEAKKYVLKQPSKQTESPAPSAPIPSNNDLPPLPSKVDNEPPMSDDMGSDMPMGDQAPMGDEEPMDGDQTGKKSDYMAEVQKFAGKLGQELRDQKERMEGDDIKYVLNMIISAVDLDKLDLEDLEEIGDKFKRDEDEDLGDDLPEPDFEETPPSEEDINEMGGIENLESFINQPISANEIDLSDYADLGEGGTTYDFDDDLIDEGDDMYDFDDESMDEEKEIDLDEIKSAINKSVSETLSKYFN